jgi:hypothetical protein
VSYYPDNSLARGRECLAQEIGSSLSQDTGNGIVLSSWQLSILRRVAYAMEEDHAHVRTT